MLQLKQPKEMPCGLDVGYEICLTQSRLFMYAVETDFDDDDFVKKYMNSDFCHRHMDALYSHFQLMNPEFIMSYLLDEITLKKNIEHYNVDAIEWIGWMYKYLQLRFEMPSKEIYAMLPLKIMLGYYGGMRTQDAEYFVDIVKEKFER